VRTILTGIKPYLILGLLCLALYLPGLAALPAVDRDEARFAQASKQMVESGDYLRIRFQKEPRSKKPAGAYWLQAASLSLFSDPGAREIWPYRLPSLAAAIAAVWLTFGLGQGLFGRKAAFAGAAMLAASLVLVVEAHTAKTDALLLATVVAAQGALGRIYLAAREGRATGPGPPLLFWAALGLGALIKGPIAPVIAALTLVALKFGDRTTPLVRPLRPLWGVPLAAAFVVPWIVAITIAGDGGFVGRAVTTDLLPKLISGQEGHGFPPGYYLLLLIVCFWPGSLFVWHGIRWAWQNRAEPAVRFCIAWLVPAWLMFELVPTKLPQYVLPLYPALALLTGRAMVAAADGMMARVTAWESRMAYVAWALAGLAIAGAVLALPILVAGRFEPIALVPVVAALTVAGAGLRQAWRGRIGPALTVATVAAFAIYATAFQAVLPGTDEIWLSRSVAEMVAREAPGKKILASTGHQEPSLVFLLGTDLDLPKPPRVALYVRSNPGAYVLVGHHHETAFREALAELGARVRPVASTRGYNYSKGAWRTVTLYQSLP
jgi:4-amino-4-deoxy-L-arabinose transferase-like glycosyltransferase